MKPFLSITIPTYNRVVCLKKAIGAILEQVGEDPQVELVISDNGSTDGTLAFGTDCAGRYPRVRYFRNEANEGFDTNVLACVHRAEGTYISFFSDDDLPAPRFFENVLKRLRDDRPTILYVNHTSFYNGNPACLGLPQAAVETFSTDDGKAFYMKCGLGFLSALTVYADAARQFTGKVVQGRGSAHLDIATRLALTGGGVFVYDGRLMVLAHYQEGASSNLLRYGVINVTKVHEALHFEGLLSGKELAKLKRQMILGPMPRAILVNRYQCDSGESEQELRGIYGSDPLYYLYAYPLLALPRKLIRSLALSLRSLVRIGRRCRHAD